MTTWTYDATKQQRKKNNPEYTAVLFEIIRWYIDKSYVARILLVDFNYKPLFFAAFDQLIGNNQLDQPNTSPIHFHEVVLWNHECLMATSFEKQTFVFLAFLYLTKYLG